MKKLLALVLVVVFAAGVFAAEADSVKSLTGEEGLKATAVTLTEAQTAKIQAAMGTKQVVKTAYSIYVGKEVVVVIEEQQGKWAPIKIAVSIVKADRKVKSVEIVSMSEKRGAGVKTSSYLGQYAGKCLLDVLEIGKDIKAVSGATVSSKAVTIAVKRALLVYEEAMPAPAEKKSK